jgi:hypothetical protein
MLYFSFCVQTQNRLEEFAGQVRPTHCTICIIVTSRLKAEIVEPEETSIGRQRFGKQVSAATDTQVTI